MSPAQRQAVRERAGGRCEYCRLLEKFTEPFSFHAEHIRTTVFLLELNRPERLVLRELMIRSGNWRSGVASSFEMDGDQLDPAVTVDVAVRRSQGSSATKALILGCSRQHR